MGDHFIVEAWALLAIATLVILLRLFYSYTRGGFWKMKMDDCSMILAGVSEPDIKQDMFPRYRSR
jgi:hypothetical protein